MLSKRSFGIAGAAMLGTVALLGTNAANAAINLDAMDKSEAAATYAIETLTATVSDDGMHYEVADETGGTDTEVLNVQGKTGVGVLQDGTLTITFDLMGMVFNESLGADDLTFTQADGTTTIALGAGSVSVATGGRSGDSQAVYHVSAQEAAIPQDAIMTLDVDMIGVSMGGGSITMTVETVVNNAPFSYSASYTGAVQLASAVSVKTNMTNATTYVAHSYSDFGPMDPDTTPRVYVANLGNLQVVVMHRNAASGAVVNFVDVFGADALAATIDDDTRAEASVMLEGSFDFGHEDVRLIPDDGSTTTALGHCDGTNTGAPVDLYVDNTATTTDATDMILVGATLNQIGAGSGTSGATSDIMSTVMHFCLTVPDGVPTAPATSEAKVKIPRTDNYTANLMAMGIDDRAGTPIEASGMLGKIERDGTMVELPYLTTDDRYNQRIIIVNRSSDMVHYEMDFTSEDGIEAERGTDGIGMLEGDSTTVLHLRRHDVVRITGGPPHRAAGTLIIEAEPENISVATNQTNMMDGGTDTVVLH